LSQHQFAKIEDGSMRYRTSLLLLAALSLSATMVAQQTIYWKKDHIYAGADGKELAIVTPPTLDTTAPTAPTNVNATYVNVTYVTLGWNASTDSGGSGLAGYKVYRQLGSGASIPVGTVGPGVLSFTDQLLQLHTTYTYKIIAFDNAQNHSAAGTLNVTTLAAPPPTDPTSLTSSLRYATGTHLTWGAGTDQSGTGLAGYRVYRSGVLISGSNPQTSLSFDDSGLGWGTGYNYTVKTVDNNGGVSSGATSSITTASSFNDSLSGTTWSPAWAMPGASGYWTWPRLAGSYAKGPAAPNYDGASAVGTVVYTDSMSGGISTSINVGCVETNCNYGPAGLILYLQGTPGTGTWQYYRVFSGYGYPTCPYGSCSPGTYTELDLCSSTSGCQTVWKQYPASNPYGYLLVQTNGSTGGITITAGGGGYGNTVVYTGTIPVANMSGRNGFYAAQNASCTPDDYGGCDCNLTTGKALNYTLSPN
jgi:hypothetical protein